MFFNCFIWYWPCLGRDDVRQQLLYRTTNQVQTAPTQKSYACFQILLDTLRSNEYHFSVDHDIRVWVDDIRVWVDGIRVWVERWKRKIDRKI